jgi:hypothetical protein
MLVKHAQAMSLGQDMPKILWAEVLNYTDNLHTTQTLEYTKDKYNVKIIKQSLS